MGSPQLRTAIAADAQFIYDVCESAMSAHVQAVGRRWAATKMREKCAQDAASGHVSIVSLEGQDCGVFAIQELEDHTFLDMLYLLPTHQRLGIGTTLLTAVRQRAGERGVPVRLQVMKANPARLFWEKHGFRVYAEDEQAFHMQSAA